MNMNNTIRSIKWGLPITLTITALLWTACSKDPLTPGTTSDPTSVGVPKACPQQTVNYTALAPIGNWQTPPTGQLNAVYNQCYPISACGSFYNATGWILVDCKNLGSPPLPPIANWPNVTYPEQLGIINYYKNLAATNAPICTGIKKKVITGMRFYRDAFITTGVCAYVQYACCGPNPN